DVIVDAGAGAQVAVLDVDVGGEAADVFERAGVKEASLQIRSVDGVVGDQPAHAQVPDAGELELIGDFQADDRGGGKCRGGFPDRDVVNARLVRDEAEELSLLRIGV